MPDCRSTPHVLIVAESASARFGGEAILPLHYFRILRRRGIEAWLLIHARTKWELDTLLPTEADRITYVDDAWLDHMLHPLAGKLPARVSYFTILMVTRLRTQRRQRAIARRMIRERGITVVHQPVPVSPKESSLLYDLGAPVVIGPMNGGMSFPPAFRGNQSKWIELFVRVGRRASGVVNLLMPGKRRAAALLVANDRTRAALPPGSAPNVVTIVENGVDLSIWQPRPDRADAPAGDGTCRFVFAGRLVDWKAVDLLLEAFATVVAITPATLDILGNGPERQNLEAKARALGLDARVSFRGWVAQPDAAQRLRASDVFVLPSLYECGGAVVLEAMAVGLPVIATAWGGPTDYLDPSCGLLVPPDSRQGFVTALTTAMLALASDPTRRREMGRAGRAKVEREYDWERKVDRILEVYASVTK